MIFFLFLYCYCCFFNLGMSRCAAIGGGTSNLPCRVDNPQGGGKTSGKEPTKLSYEPAVVFFYFFILVISLEYCVEFGINGV